LKIQSFSNLIVEFLFGLILEKNHQHEHEPVAIRELRSFDLPMQDDQLLAQNYVSNFYREK